MQDDDYLLRREEAQVMTGDSRSGQYLKIAAGEYPRPIKDGKLTKFSNREIQEYIRRKLAQRSGQ